MQTKISDEYISNRAWFRDVLAGENVILKGISALEYLQLFTGYVKESHIDVYAKNKGKYSNINYCIVNSFDNIDFFLQDDILCSSTTQAINDILSEDEKNIDEQALVEALSRYYYNNNRSFKGLDIKVNLQKFEELKEWALEFYRGT